MEEQTTSQFDFEDWAGLYLENPQEFEARRKAALMIEMTRGTPEQCARGRALIEAYDKRVVGCDTQQRLAVSASMMMESAQELNTELMMLKEALLDLEKQSEQSEQSER